MVEPSAIWVPHPLQKAIDFPRTSGLPKQSQDRKPPGHPERRKLPESGFQGKQNRRAAGCKTAICLVAAGLDLMRNVCQERPREVCDRHDLQYQYDPEAWVQPVAGALRRAAAATPPET
jgi:hypothetical protein